MKKSAYITSIASLIILLALSACSSSEIAYTQGNNASLLSTSVPPYRSDDAAAITERRNSLKERLFVGEGSPANEIGGDGMAWYYQVFGGHGFNTIPVHLIELVGNDRFVEWTEQFISHGPNGWRDWREANLRTFIDDFNITMEEIISAEESLTGILIEQIDELVMSARAVDMRTATNEEAFEAANWIHQRSLRDIEALFSDDVYEIWAAFPGYGVLHNGRVYSPEWLMQNMSRAINEEQIPLEEIERVFETAYEFALPLELLSNANAILRSEIAARR